MRQHTPLWIMLAALVPLAGCTPVSWDHAGDLPNVRPDPPRHGTVQITPRVTMKVGDTRTISATLDGEVAYFIRYRWTVTGPAVELIPRGCSDVIGVGHRDCRAELRAMASGDASVTFIANVRDFIEVRGSAYVTVAP